MTEETDSGAEIATIEQTMRTDYRTYARDLGMQARYGELLAAREAPAARGPSAVETEIATIENRIKTDNRGYQGDPAAQARYLELLQERDGTAPSLDPPHATPGAKPSTALPEGHTGEGHFTALPAANVIANLEGAGPEMAAMLKAWGGDAEANVAYMVRESTEILNGLPVEDARELELAVEAMSPSAQVKLYRHLADAGRARGTR